MNTKTTTWLLAGLFASSSAMAQIPVTAPYEFKDLAWGEKRNALFAIGTSNEFGDGVYQYKNGQWSFYSGHTGQKEIEAIDAAGGYFAVRNKEGQASYFLNNHWVDVTGTADDIEIHRNTGVWYKVNDADKLVYYLSDHGWFRLDAAPKMAKSMSLGNKQEIYIVDQAGQAWVHNGGWTNMGSRKGREIHAAADGTIWMISNELVGDGYRIYQWNTGSRKWTPSNYFATQFVRTSSGKTYTLHNTGIIKEVGANGTGTPINGAKWGSGSVTNTGGGSTGGTTGGGMITSGVDAQDANGDTKLHFAARSANTTEIVRLLDQGSNVNVQNLKGESALFDAINTRKSYVVQLLIDRGANVNLLNKQRESPLAKAVESSDLPMTQLLLDRGADVNVGEPIVKAVEKNNQAMVQLLLDRYADGGPALLVAANKNNTSMFQMLVDKGAHMASTQPFYIAAGRNNLDIARLSLRAGADPNKAADYAISKNRMDLMPMVLEAGADPNRISTYAMQKNNGELLMQALNGGAKPDSAMVDWAIKNNQTQVVSVAIQQHNADPNQALRASARYKNPTVMAIALNNGAQADQVMAQVAGSGDKQSMELLLANGGKPDLGMDSAVKSNQTEIVQMLINRGANATPAHFIKTAASKGNQPMVEMLLNAGADVNAGMDDAIAGGHAPVVKTMLDRGADATPERFIAKAAGDGKDDIVRMLLDKGASADNGLLPALKNRKNSTAKILIDRGVDASRSEYIATASFNGDKGIVQDLLNRGASADDGMNQAITGGKNEIVDVLIQFGADPTKEEYVITAVKRNRSAVLKTLLDAGAPTSHVAANGENLIHMAVGTGSVNTTKVLIDQGVDLNHVDNAGNAPLHVAVRSKSNLALAEMLINSGARVNPINNAGDTPLNDAKGSKMKKMLKNNGGFKNKK